MKNLRMILMSIMVMFMITNVNSQEPEEIYTISGTDMDMSHFEVIGSENKNLLDVQGVILNSGLVKMMYN